MFVYLFSVVHLRATVTNMRKHGVTSRKVTHVCGSLLHAFSAPPVGHLRGSLCGTRPDTCVGHLRYSKVVAYRLSEGPICVGALALYIKKIHISMLPCESARVLCSVYCVVCIVYCVLCVSWLAYVGLRVSACVSRLACLGLSRQGRMSVRGGRQVLALNTAYTSLSWFLGISNPTPKQTRIARAQCSENALQLSGCHVRALDGHAAVPPCKPASLTGDRIRLGHSFVDTELPGIQIRRNAALTCRLSQVLFPVEDLCHAFGT